MNKLVQITIGAIRPPNPYYNSINGGGYNSRGLTDFLTNVIRLIMIAASLYAFFNLIFAGYAFLSAGGDSKKVAEAWARIWQTIVGIIFVFVSFLLAATLSYLFYGGALVVFRLRLFGPY